MGLSSSLKNLAKTDNHPRSEKDKAEIRRLVIQEIGEARVFEAFAGAGRMFGKVYKDHAAKYVGCDLRLIHDDRLAFVADNRRVLRSIDLSAFNVFDLDAYGSPWEQALIIAARRNVAKGERIGVIITEGSGLFILQGGIPTAMRAIAGIKGKIGGGHKEQDQLKERALQGMARAMKCAIIRRWEARGHTGAKMLYSGVILEGKGPKAA